MGRTRGDFARSVRIGWLLAVVAAACVPAAATLAPTAAPVTPPAVVGYAPERGAELARDGTIELYFDQPMDQQSVAQALRFDPPLPGTLQWPEPGIARYVPAGAAPRAARIGVRLLAGARSANGAQLAADYSFFVHTTGYVEVTQVFPLPAAQAVDVRSTITVVFNRPVVPLAAAGAGGALPNPLLLEPAVPGSGEWQSTSIFVFTPAPGLAGGQRYSATISAREIAALSAGGTLQLPAAEMQTDYTWVFSTPAPEVLSTEAAPDGRNVSIVFNQPMDHSSTEAAFSVRGADGAAVRGSFAWAEGDATLTFKTAQRLPLNTNYIAALAVSAHGIGGGGALSEPLQFAFKSAPAPAVILSAPRANATDVDPTAGIQFAFAGHMDPETFKAQVHVSPAPADLNGWYSDYDNTYYLGFSLKAQTAYAVVLDAGLADPYGNTLGKPYTLNFTTGSYAPSFALQTRSAYGTYTAGMPAHLYASYRNVAALDLELSRMPLAEFVKYSAPGGYDYRESYAPALENKVRAWAQALPPFPEENAFARIDLDATGGTLEPGIYFLSAAAGDQQGQHVLLVADANLTLKLGAASALVWATSHQTGKPLAGRDVSLYNMAMQRIGGGTTDADGLLRTSIAPRENAWDPVYAIADARPQGFALTSSEWSYGIEPWQFGVLQDYQPARGLAYLHTDRPLYRPGQPVNFRAILRNDNDARFSIPAARTVRATVHNPAGDVVYAQQLPVSEFGTISGSFQLDAAADAGYYTLNVAARSELSGDLGFQVALYRKPEFQVSVTPARNAVVQGDAIQALVEARYYFGGPVGNAAVEWTLLATDHYFDYQGPGYFSFSDYDQTSGVPEPTYGNYGSVVASGSARTDARGQLALRVPADFGTRSGSQRFTLEATVTDIDQRPVSARTEVVGHQGDYYIGLSPQAYLGSAGKPSAVDVLAVDWQQAGVARQSLKIVVSEHEWLNVQEEDEFGNLIWNSSARDTPILETTATTDASGKAVVRFTPQTGGSYKVLASGRDRGGHEIRSSTYIWVSSEEFISWRQDNSNRINLVADRKQYVPGDTAKILIPSPFTGTATALLTVERDSVLQTVVLPLRDNSTLYELPITAALAPTVYVSVVIVKGMDADNPVPAFRMGLLKLDVSPREQLLNVQLTPDKPQTAPGEPVTMSVLATDYTGKPVSAEIALGVVDAAALALAPPNSLPMAAAFYGQRPLRQLTSLGLSILVDAVNLEVAEAKGGGGGRDEMFIEVRGDFRDTAYWNPVVLTDAAGRAQVSFSLPDNLTTWHADARAVTQDTRVGAASADIVASKALLIRPITPRFFMVGDRSSVAAIVNNNTAQEITADVTLSGSGVRLPDNARQQVQVPANGRVRVDWTVEAERSAETPLPAAMLLFTARAGALVDSSLPPLGRAADRGLPVYEYSTPQTAATSGVLAAAGTRSEVVVVPRGTAATAATLELSISPSLAASLPGALQYLEEFPHECVEQTISRFLPNVMMQKILQGLGTAGAPTAQHGAELVAAAVQRLAAQQHPDGGWGWWPTEESDSYLTAYALLGLQRAQQAGHAVPQNMRTLASAFVRARVRYPIQLQQPADFNRQVFMLYALSESGIKNPSALSSYFAERSRLAHYGRALLALAIHAEDASDPRIATLLSDLAGAAAVSATGAHWNEIGAPELANMNTDLRSTAMALSAFVRIDARNALIPNIVRWLVAQRSAQNAWETTQQTAWSLMALAEWLAAGGDAPAAYAYTLALNGKPLAQGSADGFSAPRSQTVTAPQLLAPVNQLLVQRGAGTGSLYYTAVLRHTEPAAGAAALSRGMVVSRVYTLRSKSCGAKSQPRCAPVSSVPAGADVNVTLTLVAQNDLHHVLLEDPFPAGAEPVDSSLQTSSVVGQQPDDGSADPAYYGWGWWWFSNVNLRDEKLVLAAAYLPAGTYQYTYTLHAQLAGQYNVPPATASEFYFPEVWGRSDGARFEISAAPLP